MDEERIWNAQRTALMSSVPARYTEKERAKHMAAEEERRQTLDGQETIYSGTKARLNPEMKLRITRQVCVSLSHIDLGANESSFAVS